MNDNELVAALHAHGLPGSLLRPPPGPFAAAAFAHLLRVADQRRCAGHLLAAVDDGAVEVTGEQRDQIVQAVLARSAIDLRREAALLHAVDVLDGVGVAARVLKGAAAAHLDHDRPWRRPFDDVDLLVRGDDFDTAVGALLVAGLSRRYAELRPGFDRRFTKAACLVRPDRVEIDLHRTFAMGPFGLTLRLDDLWEGSEAFAVGGRQLFALRREHRLLNACYHALLGDVARPRPTSLGDIGAVATAPLDLDLLAEHTAAWRGEAVVAEAIATAWRYLGLDPDLPVARWAASLRPTDAQRAAVRSYRTDAGGRFASTSLAGLRWLPWRDRLGYARALAFPSRSYRSTTGRTVGVRLRRAVRSVRRRS